MATRARPKTAPTPRSRTSKADPTPRSRTRTRPSRRRDVAPRGAAVVGQSGGPTAVINESLVGAILASREAMPVTKVYGARHGVAGVLADDLVDLTRTSAARLEAVARTPAAALGSVRKKPTRDECLAMFETFRRRDIRYFFYIGGNDTAETAHILGECARDERYPIRVIHVPKTIDNDLRVTDHCPGYGSAARFVAQAFMGDNLDNRSLKGVKINVVMGRHAGFLTAAAALGRREPDDGPHLVYVPETIFDEERFVADVRRIHELYGRCLVAVSEGVHDADGVTLAQKLSERGERDAHGNVQLSGSGALGDALANLVKAAMPDARVRADTFGYLQRSFVGCRSEVDAREARMVGHDAVRYALRNPSGSVVLERGKGRRYSCKTALVPLRRVAKVTKSMPARFMNKDGNDVTKAFVDYAGPLTGPLPTLGRLPGI